jgi:putative acyl-CoA dehydrogenase
MAECFSTHEVVNQPPLFENVNLLTSDRVLQDAVRREGGAAAFPALTAFGAECGSAEAIERGRLANTFLPELKAYDAQGRRLDVVEYHPAYHACMAASMKAGLHAQVWEHVLLPGERPKAGISVARAAGVYIAAQMEPGHCCPITMTNAAIPLLRQVQGLAQDWLPKAMGRTYDGRFVPMDEKSSVTFGMGMTEKQGGTDVRANATRAVPGGADGSYIITGHKWFMSAPMSDAFFILAQAPRGLSCFFMPRFLPDGSRNAIHFQRLKDKLGNRSNASSEVEFPSTNAWLVGDEGRGVATIIDMVTWTRLDCAVSSAGLIRSALAHAIYHCQGRSVFGKALIDQPLMRHVLADLALDAEAATTLAFRLAHTFDHDSGDAAVAWRRLMTPVTKYWVCKIAPHIIGEAMECLGGNGYTEAFLLARLYREAPVNAIWEGSGNVMALDVVRVCTRDAEAANLVVQQLGEAAEGEPRLMALHRRVEAIIREPSSIEMHARELVETLALLAAGVLLRAHAPSNVSNAFLSARLAEPPRKIYGQGISAGDIEAILSRAGPVHDARLA